MRTFSSAMVSHLDHVRGLRAGRSAARGHLSRRGSDAGRHEDVGEAFKCVARSIASLGATRKTP
jgi:hypothetical protein